MSALSNPRLLRMPSDWSCPFRHGSDLTCLAATSLHGSFASAEAERCDSEDHETCALYLSKILRGLRSLGGRTAELHSK